MTPTPLQELLARFERERLDADQQYNSALTALDAALQRMPDLPQPPPAYDTTRLPDLNAGWEIGADAPAVDRSLKGRLRGLVWAIVGPRLQQQGRFNAALVDHLNRNAAVHQQSRDAANATIAVLQEHIAGLLRFQSHLIAFLQKVTLYIDTKDRGVDAPIQVLSAGLGAIADDWMKRWESLAAREARLLDAVHSLDHLRPTGGNSSGNAFADVQATAQLAQQTALTVKRELERLIAPAPARASATTAAAPVVSAADLNAFKYLGFEDAFRGSRDVIRERLRTYVDRFAGLTDVLDIGCGRGEFLDLLREAGIGARGLDLNHEMVETGRARGLDVVESDALSYLQGLPPGSLGGVFAAQVVEHLAPDYLLALLDAAADKVRPGGLLVLETINPACWLAFFESYIRDITHVRPLHPETLQFLARASGFHDVTVEFLAPVAETDRLKSVAPASGADSPVAADLRDAFNDNVAKLNARMFTFMDYAIIARR
ncbi:MAG TPA: class I SAM-dependent methyltransferase [Vicinamibacterales bacterium]|nr:class I SAM-dependent methyltransferase [Vicinamibacterales bacterium]